EETKLHLKVLKILAPEQNLKDTGRTNGIPVSSANILNNGRRPAIQIRFCHRFRLLNEE
uniref:Transcriptional regulator n=1 Tax=Globodera pallida TaxID=36090 RepID=A0A183C0B4_GLOPA